MNNLPKLYDKTYQSEFERVESKHDTLPNPPVKYICGGLISVEAITVFSILLPNGLLAAVAGAALPVTFLLGIAYLYAEYFELPTAYQQLVDEYDLILTKETRSDDETTDS